MAIPLLIIFGVLLLVVVLVPVLKRLAAEAAVRECAAPGDKPLPYVRRRYLLTPAEYSFYKMLHEVLPPDRIVLVKVRLADLFEVKDGLERGERQAAQNRIASKHLDFVVCDRATCVPELGIELDDSSHDRPDRQTRDVFVDAVCRAAGLPLARQRVQRGYTREEVQAVLRVGSPAPRVGAAGGA